MSLDFKSYFETLFALVKTVDHSLLDQAVDILQHAKKADRRVFIVGNGGSAAIAAHAAVDVFKNAGIRAMTFNESSTITCLANDYGYEKWVEKALEGHAEPGDVVVLISSSGKSPNIVNAAKFSRLKQLRLITFSAFDPGNPLRGLGDVNFYLDSHHYNNVENTHQIWLLSIVDKLIALDSNK